MKSAPTETLGRAVTVACAPLIVVEPPEVRHFLVVEDVNIERLKLVGEVMMMTTMFLVPAGL